MAKLYISTNHNVIMLYIEGIINSEYVHRDKYVSTKQLGG